MSQDSSSHKPSHQAIRFRVFQNEIKDFKVGLKFGRYPDVLLPPLNYCYPGGLPNTSILCGAILDIVKMHCCESTFSGPNTTLFKGEQKDPCTKRHTSIA
jgi:hypothetical protein